MSTTGKQLRWKKRSNRQGRLRNELSSKSCNGWLWQCGLLQWFSLSSDFHFCSLHMNSYSQEELDSSHYGTLSDMKHEQLFLSQIPSQAYQNLEQFQASHPDKQESTNKQPTKVMIKQKPRASNETVPRDEHSRFELSLLQIKINLNRHHSPSIANQQSSFGPWCKWIVTHAIVLCGGVLLVKKWPRLFVKE